MELLVAALFGGYVASFIALAAWRIPRHLSVWRPGSFCPGCDRALVFWETILVASWLALRGRCRTCGATIPVRDLVFEGLGASVGLVVTAAWGWTPTGLLMACLWFGWLAIAVVDWDHAEVPLSVIGGLAVLWGLAWWDHLHGGWIVVPADPLQGVLVMAAVTGLALLVTRGRYGLGDGFLGIVMGLYLGAYWALLAWILANLLMVPLIIGRKRGTEIPFAPGLGAAVALCSLPPAQILWLHWFPYVLPF